MPGAAPGKLTTEDRGMTAASLTFVNMPEHFWSLMCCAGVILIAWFLSRVRLDEKGEDMSFYQSMPLAVLWSSIGITLILFNKFIFLPFGYGFDFPYTVFLMWWHALVGTIVANLLFFARPSLMPTVAEGTLSWKSYGVNVFPIAFLQAAGLAFGNTAYLHISVAYIQMVKNTTSAFVFIFSIMLSLEKCTTWSSFAVAMVVTGLLMTTVGELDFAWLGFLFQMAGTLCDSLRLTLTKIILSSRHGVKMDPMSALYYFSPTVLLILSIPMYFVDFQRMSMQKVWDMKFVLLTNAVLAFSLNMTSMFFMKRCGATTYALTGVVKDVALIILCCVLFSHPISAMQIAGFVISLFGFQLYNQLKTDQAYVLKMWYSFRGVDYNHIEKTATENSSLLNPEEGVRDLKDPSMKDMCSPPHLAASSLLSQSHKGC
jgi:hypothetical protein